MICSFFTDENPSSLYECHTIALLNTTEDYDNLHEALADIADEMKNFQSVNVDGKQLNLEFYLGGD